MASEPFILGQSRAQAALLRALRGGHVHHAWIFHGPQGVGKFRTAHAFARLLLDPDAPAPAGELLVPPEGTACARLIAAGTHPDLHVVRKELAALSESRELRERKQLNIPLDLLRERMLGGVDGDGRHLESAVFRTAARGHGKVFIVDEAELLDADGQNAMLKTLEEPPAGTTIILVTQREDRLLPTIRSRCQRLGFGPLDAAAMARWWEREGPKVDAPTRAFADAFAQGAPGMATLAVAHGLAAWDAELSPALDALEQGRFAPLGDRMAELVDTFAKGIVDADEQASKDAANRLGTRLLVQLLAMRVRRGLRDACADAAAARRWIDLAEALDDFERHVRSNVNLKHAFGNLVAQWAERATAGGAGARAAGAAAAPGAGAARGR
ncbi:MAG: AAA family ATPase [Phycisphaerales bacterium]